MIVRSNVLKLSLSLLLIFFGCQSVEKETMQPDEYAKKVSEIIINETKFDFEPAIQEFEQDGVYLYDFSSQEKGVFLARSVVNITDSEMNDFTPYLAVNQQAGSLSVFLNGTQVYKNTVTEDEYLNHVDYGLFEFKNKVPIDLRDGNHDLVVKFKPLKKGKNRVHISFIRSDNALPFPGIGVKSPSNKEEFDHYGYWWIGPLKDGNSLNKFTANDISEKELVSQNATDISGNTIRWDVPKLHLVKSLPGWLTFQNWHYSGGTFLDAMRQVGEHFPNQDYSSYINDHTNFLEDNIEEIEQTRKDYGLIEGPFGHYFRASLLDDMGMQTVPYVSKILDTSPKDRDKSSFEYRLTDKVVGHIMNDASRLDDGTFARFTPDTMSVWADDLFMGSIVLLKMNELTGNEEYLNEVVKQVIQFDNYLLDNTDNLYWHGWFSRNEEHSSTKWGRANGWTMMTKVELLKVMPEDHPKRQEVLEIFKRHALGLKEVQSSDGRWHQVLDDPNTYLETSATGMFVRAFAAGINEGWLEKEDFKGSVELGWKALTNQFDENGDVSGIVRGTPIMFSDEDYENWGTRRSDPRGLGALLYASIEVDKMMNGSN